MLYNIQDPRINEINAIKELEYVKFYDLTVSGDVDEDNKQIIIPALLISYNNGKNLCYSSKDDVFGLFVHKVLEVYKEEKGIKLDDSDFGHNKLHVEDARSQRILDNCDILNKNQITEMYEDMDSYDYSLMFESDEVKNVMDIIRYVLDSFGKFTNINIELLDNIRGYRTNYILEANINDLFAYLLVFYNKIDENTYDISIGNIGGVNKALNIRINFLDDQIQIMSNYEDLLFDYVFNIDDKKATFITRILKNQELVSFDTGALPREEPPEKNLVLLSGVKEEFSWYKLPWRAYYGYRGSQEAVDDITTNTYKHFMYLDINNEDFYKREFYSRNVKRNSTVTKVGVNLTLDALRKTTFGYMRKPYFVIETSFKNARGDGNYQAKYNGKYYYHVIKAKDLSEIKKEKLVPVKRVDVMDNVDLLSDVKLRKIGGRK